MVHKKPNFKLVWKHESFDVWGQKTRQIIWMNTLINDNFRCNKSYKLSFSLIYPVVCIYFNKTFIIFYEALLSYTLNWSM